MALAGRKTGPKPSFTLEDAVNAALEIGVAEFTLTGVAGRLRVGTPALYRIVTCRDDLLRACLDRIAGASEFSYAPAACWQDSLTAFTDRFWQLLDEHPGLSSVLVNTTWAHQSFARQIEATNRALRTGGLSEQKAALALDMVADTVLITYLEVSGSRRMGVTDRGPETGLETTWRRLRDEDLGQIIPKALHPDESWSRRGWLERKVQVIVKGLEH